MSGQRGNPTFLGARFRHRAELKDLGMWMHDQRERIRLRLDRTVARVERARHAQAEAEEAAWRAADAAPAFTATPPAWFTAAHPDIAPPRGTEGDANTVLSAAPDPSGTTDDPAASTTPLEKRGGHA